MSYQNEITDTINMDKLGSGDLKEKMLELIDKGVELKPTSGRADNVDILVSKNLKNRRLMLGLSQQDISKVIGVSIQQVQKYEKGINRISSGKLFATAKLLKVPITYFYEQTHDSRVIDSIVIEDANNPDEKEIINLIRAFNEIKSLSSRKKIIELMRTIS